MGIKVDRLEKVDRNHREAVSNHQEVMSLLPGFIAEIRVCIIAGKNFQTCPNLATGKVIARAQHGYHCLSGKMSSKWAL